MPVDGSAAVRLGAPEGFRRFVLAVGLVLVALELWAFWIAARLTALLDVTARGRHDLGGFVVFWTAMTLQAMVIVGFAWTLVAVSRTTLTGGDPGLAMEHPWRRWSGAWSELAEAYPTPGWLHVRVRGHWRTWHVRLTPESAEDVEAVRRRADGAWLEADAGRLLLLKRMLPIVVIATLCGGGAMLALENWLERLVPR